jgi:hypothetical protein
VCPDGYHGDRCDKPIKSCAGYSDLRRESGKYKLVDFGSTLYEVYCHFDSDGAWTLVQSYIFKNKNSFKDSLSVDHPVNENDPNWSKYRLGQARMRTIKENSTYVQFTCDYQKVNLDIKKSDYLQISLQTIKQKVNDLITSVDILRFSGYTTYITIPRGFGATGDNNLTDCEIWLHQGINNALHVHIVNRAPKCNFDSSCDSGQNNYFGSFVSPYDCIKKLHRCVQKDGSTTQLWFGTRKVQAEQASDGNAENPGSSFGDSENNEQ